MAIRNNPFKPLIKKIPAPIRNKYYLVLVAFFGWMIFFDKHDMLTQWHLQQTLQKLEADKGYYHQRIQEAKQDKQTVDNNRERFARESYYMSKPDEEVFIIEPTDK